jgi:hypothetical protein
MILSDRFLRPVLGTLGLLVTLHGVATAQPTAEENRWAGCLVAEGRVLRARNDLDGALRRFQAADKLVHAPTTGLEVAELQSILGSLVEARRTLRGVLAPPASPEAGVDPVSSTDVVAKAAKLDEELKNRMAHLRFQSSGVPAGKSVDVFLDGGGTPLGLGRIDVNPGHHAIVATLEGRQVSREVDLHESDDVAIPLSFDAPLVARAGDPAGEVTADGRARQGLPKVAYIGFGVGAAGMVVGGVTGVLALMAKKSAEKGCAASRCPPPASWDGDQTQRALSKASTASMIVGAAGVGLAIGSLFMQKKPKVVGGTPLGNVGSSLRINPSMGGASVSGKF